MANDFAAAAKQDRQTAIFGRMPRAKAKHLASRNFTPKSVRELMGVHQPALRIRNGSLIAAERVEPQEIF